MKKDIKIVNILLVAMMIVMTFSTVVMATSGKPTPDSIIGEMDKATGGTDTGIATIGGNIVNMLTTAGIVIAVIVLLILGIKYMMGSASEKAEYKKTMIPYLVGAVLVLGASSIVKIVFSTLNFVA